MLLHSYTLCVLHEKQHINKHMILATIFTFIVERSSKNMYFHPTFAWPPATYDVISRNQSNWPSVNFTQNLREGRTNSYWKRQKLMSYRQGKTKKNLMEGWGHPMSIRCVTLHSVRDRRGAASLRHRNSTEITVLVCEQKSNLMWFSWRCKSYSV